MSTDTSRETGAKTPKAKTPRSRTPAKTALQWVILAASLIFMAALLRDSAVAVFQYKAF